MSAPLSGTGAPTAPSISISTSGGDGPIPIGIGVGTGDGVTHTTAGTHPIGVGTAGDGIAGTGGGTTGTGIPIGMAPVTGEVAHTTGAEIIDHPVMSSTVNPETATTDLRLDITPTPVPVQVMEEAVERTVVLDLPVQSPAAVLDLSAPTPQPVEEPPIAEAHLG